MKVRGGKKKEDVCSNEKEITVEAEDDGKEGISIKKDICMEILLAQERHTERLASDMVSLEGQKKEIEESLVNKWKECVQWAKATGVSVPHPFEADFSQEDSLVRFLEDSMKEKKANLECPVSLEVIDSYVNKTCLLNMKHSI